MVTPVYVTFEQAKLLKEKGFDLPTYSFYVIDEDGGYGDLEEFIQNPNGNFPLLDDNTLFDTLTSAPEQWQVIEWLRVEHGVWIQVCLSKYGEFYCSILKKEPTKDLKTPFSWETICSFYNFNSPQKACSNAIDYILNNLI